MATATLLTECSIVRIEKEATIRALSEKRLARIPLLLANYGQEGKPELVIEKISQETLAEMIGTTRSRVSHFMNKFRVHLSPGPSRHIYFLAECERYGTVSFIALQ